MEGGLHHHGTDITGVSIRNAIKLDFESVTNSIKNDPSELLTFYEKCV